MMWPNIQKSINAQWDNISGTGTGTGTGAMVVIER